MFINLKKKFKAWTKEQWIRKYGTSEGAYRAWDTRGRSGNQSSDSSSAKESTNQPSGISPEVGAAVSSLLDAGSQAKTEINQRESQERRGQLQRVAVYRDEAGNATPIDVDGKEFRGYTDTVTEMLNISNEMSGTITSFGREDSGRSMAELNSSLLALDRLRSEQHTKIVMSTVNRMIKENPALAGQQVKLTETVRAKVGAWADKIISHVSKSL